MNIFLSMEILWIFLGSSQNWTIFIFFGGGGGISMHCRVFLLRSMHRMGIYTQKKKFSQYLCFLTKSTLLQISL